MERSTRQAILLTELVLRNENAPVWLFQLANDVFYKKYSNHAMNSLWHEVAYHVQKPKQFQHLIGIELKCRNCPAIVRRRYFKLNALCFECRKNNNRKRALISKRKNSIEKLSPF